MRYKTGPPAVQPTSDVNMRSLAAVVLAALCVAAVAHAHAVPLKQQSRVADSQFLANQAKLFELLQHVHQHEHVHERLRAQCDRLPLSDHLEPTTNVEAAKAFVQLHAKGQLIGHDAIFAFHDAAHMRQAIALFRVLYYARDFAGFYQALLWARFHVNPVMFVYALTVATLHRADLAGYELPAPYEIFPHYYFGSETIQMAQTAKMQGFGGLKKVEGVYAYTIPSNYTSAHFALNAEQKLAYFTEDIGLNAFYYYFHMDYPYWMDGGEFGLAKDRRGEFYLYLHQQLLARFYMERLSNDLGAIPEYSLLQPIASGYHPALRYYNGQYFPARENNHLAYTAQNYYLVERAQDIERRLRDAIASGFLTLPDGSHRDLSGPEAIDVLGNLIQGNADSLNQEFYGLYLLLTKALLGGGSPHHHHSGEHYAPSALETIETSMRDPLFYQMHKRVAKLYWQFKNRQPAYQRSEIEFAGVTIDAVDMDKLETFFDQHDADITNAVNVAPFDVQSHKASSAAQNFGRISHYGGEELLIKARQVRLNHVPFSYRLTVQSKAALPGVVRVYMAPKFDEFGHRLALTENRENFFMLDAFRVELAAGPNVIERDSQQYAWYVKDRTTFFELYRWVMTSAHGETKFTLDMTEAHNGLPQRLLLPKGKKAGMPFQFFFIVSPLHAPAVEPNTGFDPVVSSGVGSGARFLDTLPFGYPFDRPIEADAWYTSNMFFKDVSVFHKKEAEINAVHYEAE